MSEVVATIILLGITVSLFSAVFIFVNRFPTPPPQGLDQFQASLVLDPSSASHIYGVKVVLGAGPIVSSSARIYLVPSSPVAGTWQFSQPNGIPVLWGLNGTNTSTSYWSSGQVWFTHFKVEPTLPFNIGVDVIRAGTLLFQVTLSGATVSFPPVVSQVWTSPSYIRVGQNFTVNVVMTGNLTGVTATIYLGGIPVLSSTAKPLTINPATGSGSFTVTPSSAGTTTTPGSYLAFIQGHNGVPQNFTAAVSVVIHS